ncbi:MULTISPECIES: amidase family protein [Flavobacteriaceae]|uniref:Amidase n=2 Tax=Flavobacteriaceae TaxID=49546 RepID=A0A4Y8AWM1_9FLAO|nr:MULTISPECIES: amidase family protein [Flavobacteriaceae]TEW76422.1 amidase [Gramella jeungdoensis]GGK52722.1 amidase [Lutibacter litoralis]
MKNLFSLVVLLVLLVTSCKQKESSVTFIKYDETSEIAALQNHEINRMKFKLIQSKYLDMNEVFKPFEEDLAYFSEEDYQNLVPFILEKDIPTIQEYVNNSILSYERIVLFYLYRIRKFESNNDLALHSIIALNSNIVKEAREKDRKRPSNLRNTVFGLPILLKDNINTIGMATTAGAFALQNNTTTDDAFIVKKLKENGALILGKANLSEWAYYFCSGCPVGYSAIGGQTLNPYGRKIFETGGSSSGSGVTVAANFAVAAVGTETSGSILSPSSQNSVVGLKPTIGLLSRTGIVPISSTLDTPGPMTKSVVDNAIFLSAMLGEDSEDMATEGNNMQLNYVDSLKASTLKGKRLGVIKELLTDSIYKRTVQIIKRAGAEVIEFEQPQVRLNGFLTLLNIDMKHDLPIYLKNYADSTVEISSVEDVVNLNLLDSISRAPYGQQLFEGIINDTTSTEAFELVKQNLNKNGIEYLSTPMEAYNLDAILSINNYHAGFAAVAKYPCLTVPMGYKKSGEPISLTFIAKPYQEQKLLQLGYAFEKLTKVRKLPKGYK